jgi:hypothetical protein
VSAAQRFALLGEQSGVLDRDPAWSAVSTNSIVSR